MEGIRFRPEYAVEIVPGEGVLLAADGRYVVLQGSLCERVVSLVDGERTASEIVRHLDGEADPAEVAYVLKNLERGGYLTSVSGFPSRALALRRDGAISDHEEPSPSQPSDRVEVIRVPRASSGPWIILTGLGRATDLVGDLTDVLDARGVFNCRSSVDAPIRIVLTDDYLHPELTELSRQAFSAGSSLLLVKPAGRQLWVGPLCAPGRTKCWECLARRIRLNFPALAFLRERRGADFSLPGAAPADDRWPREALRLAAGEVANWIQGAGGDSLLMNAVVRLCAGPCGYEVHTFEDVRPCAVCVTKDAVEDGRASPIRLLANRPPPPEEDARTAPLGSRRKYSLLAGDTVRALPVRADLGRSPLARETRRAAPIRLQRAHSPFAIDGSFRSESPSSTLRRLMRHVSPITGIVRRLRRLSDEQDELLHVYSAAHGMSFGRIDLHYLRRQTYDTSTGKGPTDVEARVGALGEALERYSGIYRGDEICYRDSFTNLGDEAIHPNACMNFSSKQFRERDLWNSRCGSRFNRIPEAFDTEAVMDWSPLWSLTNETARLLPTAYCYYSHPGPEASSCPADSNGNAAGSTLEEAILHGFLELVERDAVALWWYNRVRRPCVDLKSLDDPYVEAVRRFYQRIGRDVWVLDLTTDLRIPVVAAVSCFQDRRPGGILFGFAAHLNAATAVIRALMEMNQLRTILSVSKSNEINPFALDPLAGTWMSRVGLNEVQYLCPPEGSDPIRAEVYSSAAVSEPGEAVRLCVETARDLGLEVLVLDQTRPEVDLCVAKVVVPGLRHFWRRLAPGRMNDVPVSLGWLDRPIAEEDLNPVPVFL